MADNYLFPITLLPMLVAFCKRKTLLNSFGAERIAATHYVSTQMSVVKRAANGAIGAI